MEPTSYTVLEGFRKGDPGLSARFDDRYRPLLCLWATRRHLNRADAEDVAQQVIVKLFHNKFRAIQRGSDRKFTPFLRLCLNNAVFDHFGRQQSSQAEIEAAKKAAQSADVKHKEAEEAESRRELFGLAWDSIERGLSEQERILFLRFWRDGEKVKDIAGSTGKTPNAVSKTLQGVKQKLSEAVAGLDD